MATTSRIPAVQDQLKTLLAARSALQGILISVGDPATPRPAEFIQIASLIDEWTQEWPVPEQKAESWTQPIHIVVEKASDYVTARDRAFAILAEVEAQLHGDRTLSGVAWDANIARGAIGEIIDSEFKVVVVTINLDCAEEFA